MSQKLFIVVILLYLGSIVCSDKVIMHEIYSNENLEQKLKVFNEWYAKFNPESSKVEARLTEDHSYKRIGLFSKQEIKQNENYLKIARSKMISAQSVYDTEIGEIIKEKEKTGGYDDYTNLVFFLLAEMKNPSSQWKAYLDLLPRQPTSLAFKYWERKHWIEDELMHTPILKKIVEYKFLIQKKSKYYFNLVVNNNSALDQDWYSTENIEWACIILDSRLIYIGYEAFLVPMLDFANYKENETDPHKVLAPVFTDNSAEIKSGAHYTKDQEIFESLKYSNDNYLVYHGIVLENNYHDCYSVALNFLNNREDKLKEKRREFFSRFFLYDDQEQNTIDECISVRNPFPRRLLFFYYVSIMDEAEIHKLDPKRIGLESDRIIIETVKNALQGFFDLYPTKIEEDQKRLQSATERHKAEILKFQIEQKKSLLKLIEHYQFELNKLMKDDIL